MRITARSARRLSPRRFPHRRSSRNSPLPWALRVSSPRPGLPPPAPPAATSPARLRLKSNSLSMLGASAPQGAPSPRSWLFGLARLSMNSSGRAKRVFAGIFCILIGAAMLSPSALRAADIGDVRGVVHDAQHRPVADATVQLKAAASAWVKSMHSGPSGEFAFAGVPLGDYVVTVSQSGFVTTAVPLTVVAGAAPSTHIQLTAGES